MEKIIYKGNNISLLDKLKSEKKEFDFIYIDPPYNSDISDIGYADKFNGIFYGANMAKVLSDSYKVLSNDGVMVIQIDENGFDAINNTCQYLFKGEYNIFIWDKLGPDYKVKNDHKLEGKSKDVIRQAHEYIFIVSKNRNKIKQFSNVNTNLTFKTILSDKKWTSRQAKKEYKTKHTPKPIGLIEHLINSFVPNPKNVLDIYLGTGTTLISAERANAKCITAIDIDLSEVQKRFDEIHFKELKHMPSFSAESDYWEKRGIKFHVNDGSGEMSLFQKNIMHSFFRDIFSYAFMYTEANSSNDFKVKNISIAGMKLSDMRNKYFHEALIKVPSTKWEENMVFIEEFIKKFKTHKKLASHFNKLLEKWINRLSTNIFLAISFSKEDEVKIKQLCDIAKI